MPPFVLFSETRTNILVKFNIFLSCVVSRQLLIVDRTFSVIVASLDISPVSCDQLSD